MDILSLYQLFLQHSSVSTDTRTIKKGDMFFGLKGTLYNGNAYTQQALDAGASFCITDEDTGLNDDRVLRVDDSLETLQQLALHHRMEFEIPFIAITGTNGKTTTKELVHAVLSTSNTTYTTEGNLNNHIGIPLTLLKIRKDAHMAVVEMGANHIGEIKSYCNIVRPNFGLITNCGKAHLEGFGSEEGVRKGKGELFDHLRAHGGTAFINNQLPYLLEMSEGISKKVFYGDESKVSTDGAGAQLSLELSDGMMIRTQLVGAYNHANVEAAIAIGKYFQIPLHKIKTALENYVPSNNRSQLKEWKSNKVILDAYNANPSSMAAAIKNFASLQSDKKILILGGMKEMGSESNAEHQSLVDLISQYKWERVLLVGEEFKNLPAEYLHFQDSESAKQWLKENPVSGAHILLKGSRGLRMEKVLE
jgi:UDP-N-acetylmuramoyl-tripeptide--D-alanyl-D-alanine ligase